MSRKRSRTEESSSTSGAEADKRIQELASLEYDRVQLDNLLKQYREHESEDNCVSESTAPEMVCCPREYEERFLCEPVSPERPCVRGNKCEGLRVLCKDPFILREFLYPGQAMGDARTLCLLCRRVEISRAYYRYETAHVPVHKHVRITDHYNLVGVPGEYDVKDCIVSSSKYSGVPLPVVLHLRSAYTSHMKDGVRYLSQSRMRVPGETEHSSSSSFLMRRAALTKKVALSKNSPTALKSS